MSFRELLQSVEDDPGLRLARIRAGAARRISSLLASMRADAGLTQAELGRRLGVSQARISQIESGLTDTTPALDFAFAYADACGRTMDISAVPTERIATEATESPIVAAVVAAAPELSSVEVEHVREDILRLVGEARRVHSEGEAEA